MQRNNQVPPSTTTVQSSIPLTEDGYAVLEPEDDMTEKKPEDSYTLLLNENSGYDEVNDHDPMEADNEESPELAKENAGSDDYDYAEPYWEPANKEEELMSQLYSTLKLQRIPAESVE